MGALEVLWQLREALQEITGMEEFCLQPAAGAHGEYLAMKMIRRHFIATGHPERDVVIVPDSAHGTNPASVRMAGMRTVQIPSGSDGHIDRDKLQSVLTDLVALAQARAHDPELLILDEPHSGMDPIARRRTIRLIKEWAREGRSILVSSHILHEIEAMTSSVLLINNGRILAEGDVHQIRELIDEHPHTVYVKSADPRGLARHLLTWEHVRSLRLEAGAIVAETGRPDEFYAGLTELAASGEYGGIDEVTSPDDNLQAVFSYLVK